MFWLAVHMWGLLLSAFTIGILTGLAMRGQRKKKPRSSGLQPGASQHGTLDLDAPAATEG